MTPISGLPASRRLPALLGLTALTLLALCGTAVSSSAAPATAATAGTTTYGSTVQLLPGESWANGIGRLESTVGHLGAVRVFQNAPRPSMFTPLGSRSGVFSFDVPPDQVLSGAFDSAFSAFFAAAPTDHPTWWTYFHEPDVAFHQGRIPDLAQYRSAATYVARLARAAHNPELQDMVVLVGWTASPYSHRNPADYLPDDPGVVDVLAFDNYNGGAVRQGRYGDPHQMVADDKAAADALGKPWAVGEFGSVVLNGDTVGRAAWITTFCQAARDAGALFVDYYDSDQYGQGADYRLLDAPSQDAYRQFLQPGT